MADPKRSLVERLFAEHRAALQAFFRQRIKSKADAPDLTQEVYLRMLRASDTEAIRDPARYLYAVASNLVREHALLDQRQASGVDVDEGSLNDLAARTGITSGNAAVRVHRAREALRKQVRTACGSCAEHGCLDCHCGPKACG